jgi:DNA-binding MurR/RpiR family transcriptional regulator
LNFFNYIEKTRANLNKNENELLKYFIENSKNIKGMKIQDASKNTFVSTAAIIRFCKKLGFSGYSDFKNTLWHTINNQNENKEIKKSQEVNSDIF